MERPEARALVALDALAAKSREFLAALSLAVECLERGRELNGLEIARMRCALISASWLAENAQRNAARWGAREAWALLKRLRDETDAAIRAAQQKER